MILSYVSVYELQQYLSILLWIALPLILVALFVAVIFHNLRKKRRVSQQEAYPELAPDTDFLAQTSTDTDTEKPAYKGMIWLRTRYQQDMEKADHKFYVLSEECRRLEKKVEDLLSVSSTPSINRNKILPENTEPEISADVAIKIQHAEISADEKQQLMALQGELAQLREVNTKLQHEIDENKKSYGDSQGLIPAPLENEVEALRRENKLMQSDKTNYDALTWEKTEQLRVLQIQNEEYIILINKLKLAAEENTMQKKELQAEILRRTPEYAHEQEAIMHGELMHSESVENELQALKDQHVQEKRALRESLDLEIKKSKDLHKKLEMSSGLLQKIVKEINTTAFETPRIAYKEGHPPVFQKATTEEKRPKISAWIESSLGEEN